MDRIVDFLVKNGYAEDTDFGAEYRSFFKRAVSSIDINDVEVVLIGESGDWLHLPTNYYAVIGALLHHRELACDYV